MIIDTHCHIDNSDENVINEIKPNKIIVSGHDVDSNKYVIELCEKYNNVYGTIGYHPDIASLVTDYLLELLDKQIKNPKIVAVGEIGLDYYWNKENKNAQKELFIKQIEIAKKNNLGIVIHSRDAIEDTYNIIRNYDIKSVMHCYSGSLEMAKILVKKNVKLGIGGVVTFKNAKQLKEVVKEIDLKHLLLETDSPYLTPEPFRGQKNSPKNVGLVAMEIAKIKGLSYESVVKTTTENAVSQFDLNSIL